MIGSCAKFDHHSVNTGVIRHFDSARLRGFTLYLPPEFRPYCTPVTWVNRRMVITDTYNAISKRWWIYVCLKFKSPIGVTYSWNTFNFNFQVYDFLCKDFRGLRALRITKRRLLKGYSYRCKYNKATLPIEAVEAYLNLPPIDEAIKGWIKY